MSPILVTGAAGRVGGVGHTVVELLRKRGLPVRAFVHHDDDRAASLRAIGAEIVVGDLTRAEDVSRALDGVKRIYFGLGVSPQYIDATVTMAAMARNLGEREALLNMSQMTVSQMSATRLTDSAQQREHWLGEQVLNWSGLPVVHLRPTVFLENPLFLALAAESIAADSTLRLPFGNGRTSPIAASDVARVAATILADPARHVGHVYELTGPRSEDMRDVADEYSSALGRTIRYVDVPFDEWRDRVLRPMHLPEHLAHHIETMARLHAENRYDRLTRDVETITGQPPESVRDFVAEHADLFARPAEAAAHV
jgi:NAD(P)H dehydrogenase (quinone)